MRLRHRWKHFLLGYRLHWKHFLRDYRHWKNLLRSGCYCYYCRCCVTMCTCCYCFLNVMEILSYELPVRSWYVPVC